MSTGAGMAFHLISEDDLWADNPFLLAFQGPTYGIPERQAVLIRRVGPWAEWSSAGTGDGRRGSRDAATLTAMNGEAVAASLVVSFEPTLPGAPAHARNACRLTLDTKDYSGDMIARLIRVAVIYARDLHGVDLLFTRAMPTDVAFLGSGLGFEVMPGDPVASAQGPTLMVYPADTSGRSGRALSSEQEAAIARRMRAHAR